MKKTSQVSSENRTSLSEAVSMVLGTLKNERALTVNDIAKETHLNPRTVRKTISVLEETHSIFQREKLVVSKTNSGVYLTIEPRQIGLLNLPEDVQHMLIRTKYFPQPSREQETLVYLFLKKAIDKKSATFLDNSQSIVKDLLKAENIAMTDDSKMYLTDIGKMVAQGTLEIYPELNVI
jgi:DNA-binding transcriptional regulator YhcF (GntR family)